MAEKFAVVSDGIVENIIIWDGVQPLDVPDGVSMIAVPDDAQIDLGYCFDGTGFAEA